MVTVLSNFSAAGFGQANLLAKMGEVFENQAVQRTNTITSRYTARINSVNLTKDRWETVRTGIQDARSVISTTSSKAKSILSSIDNMISAVNKAEQNSDESYSAKVYAGSFDAYLSGLDSTAKSSSVQPNLLGTAKTELTFRAGINGTTTTVNSAFLGSDYYIVDDESKYWALDRSAKTLKRYDEYPDDPTSTVGNFQTGLQLDDIDGDSITFTVGQDTADPQTFTGTLHRKGLEILDSWAYDGLSTEDGRARALADLKAAKAAIELEVRRYEITFTVSDFYESVATEAIVGLRKKTDSYMIQQAAEIQEAQAQLARDYQNAASSVTQSIAMQNQYAKLLSPLFNDSLINVFA